ncbi:hypothetical protein HanXRQr2_Chr13g0574161 [Helianthus annuus]|uniref:Uncharacterized protein n=1 Tax=Helianthus annuus TaxID=4232 RepID=A0A9K3HAG6_HELAN|nr:hypothetical protein HanXRQr2_Chr13g0574161 [Helianthus annuus]
MVKCIPGKWLQSLFIKMDVLLWTMVNMGKPHVDIFGSQMNITSLLCRRN